MCAQLAGEFEQVVLYERPTALNQRRDRVTAGNSGSLQSTPHGRRRRSTKPDYREAIGRLATASAEATNEAVHRAHEAFLEWRKVPAPQRGELMCLFAEELRASKVPLGPLGHHRSGQDRFRRSGRGAGDDRHLHVCLRSLAAACGPDHHFRTAAPPDDGNVASLGCGRGDLRVQFPCRSLGVVCGSGIRLW
jgi:Aldehyde dehydrogenase family